MGSVALIVAATLLPVGGMAAERIPPAWCLRCGGLWLTDIISNVVLFLPFGVALGLWRWPLWRVALMSLCFSAAIEVMQSLGLPPGRSPSLADVVANTVGGVVGLLLMHGWHWQRTATRVQLSVLALGWSAMVCAVLTWSAYMLTSVTGVGAVRASGARIAPSEFGHVPGHGWYQGSTDSAFVGTMRITRGWSGPVIQQIGFEQLPVTAGVTVRGSDQRFEHVPLLFVHLPLDSSAWLQISKFSDGAELTVLRRAWQWGLTMPSVMVPHAFAGRTVNDARPLSITAEVTASQLRLRTSGAHDGESSLALTPLLGWALIQPLITVQSPLAWLAHFGWVFVLVAPIGWCTSRAARPLVVGALSGVLVTTTFVAIPIQMALSSLPDRDWTVSVLCFVCGCVLARGYRAHHDRRSASSIA